MNIEVSGKSYRVNIPSAYNPFCSYLNSRDERVVGGILPEAPYELWEEFQSVWSEVIKNRTQNSKVKTWKIQSSNKKSSYTVTRKEDGFYSCTCKGFMFRKSCRHIDQVKESI